MSILQSLVNAYDRLPDAPPFGFSSEKIGFAISLNDDGSVAHVIDLRTGDGKKKQAVFMQVPQAVKRTVGIASNFLWDKSSYVLGVTAGEGKRTYKEHEAFKSRHLAELEGQTDIGLMAFRSFLSAWQPEHFVAPLWPDDMKDQNIVFVLESERRRDIYLHDRVETKILWVKQAGDGSEPQSICLVTGEMSSVARLHPSIKGVWGAQSSGASLVSFNLDSFTSYGHEQGDNAPISEGAAFKYTTTLNRFLEKNSSGACDNCTRRLASLNENSSYSVARISGARVVSVGWAGLHNSSLVCKPSEAAINQRLSSISALSTRRRAC